MSEDFGAMGRLVHVTRATPSDRCGWSALGSAAALLACALCTWSLAAPSASAQASSDETAGEPDEVSADNARLIALRPAERAVLMPHLDDGPVMLTEFSNAQTALPAVTMMARVHASADAVADVIAHPEGYEAFMPALDSVEVRARQGVQVAYSWQWTVAIFTLRGDNVMTVYPSHPTRGHRIEVTSTEGDLGRGRFLWRIYPESEDSCVVVFASRIDMRDANYLSQQMASGGNSVNRTINIALSMMMLLATTDEAERRASYTPPQDPDRTLERPNVNINDYAGLLGRGDLVFLQLEGQRLHGVTSLARTGTTEPRIRALMRTPAEFGELLGVRQPVVGDRDDRGEHALRVGGPDPARIRRRRDGASRGRHDLRGGRREREPLERALSLRHADVPVAGGGHHRLVELRSRGDHAPGAAGHRRERLLQPWPRRRRAGAGEPRRELRCAVARLRGGRVRRPMRSLRRRDGRDRRSMPGSGALRRRSLPQPPVL